MNIFQKFNIIIDLKNHPYSKGVDEIVLKLIENGKYVNHDRYYVYINHNNTLYRLWIANYPYADLSECSKITKINEREESSFIYDKLRPSRKSQIKFWEWAEQYIGKDFHKVRKHDNLNYKEYQKILKK